MQLNFNKDRFAVVGLGDTGLSIINYLRLQNANIVRVYDTRETPPNLDKIGDFKMHLGAMKYTDFDDVDVIVISPGVSIYEPALAEAMRQNKKVIGDIELFAQSIAKWKTKIIGITGSNGKTTVTSLTGHLCQSYGLNTLVAGNIGTPVLNSYIEIVKSGVFPDVIVLELSSFQLETLHSLKLNAATVLNISEDHLDRYRDLLEYAYIKANIFNNCGTQVLNYNDILVKAMLRPEQKAFWFGEGINAQQDVANMFIVRDNNLVINGKQYIACNELNLVGRHNYLNVLAVLGLVKAIGIDIYSEKIKNALKLFRGLEHRMQKVTTHNGVLYIEDSKGTNVGAVIAGVSGLDCMVHLILGGDGKGQNFTPLRQLVADKCKSVAIIGQDKLAIADVLQGLNVKIELFATLQEAVAFCCRNAESGDAVVLSPACASWDMFTNYKHRAQVFVESINAYIH